MAATRKLPLVYSHASPSQVNTFELCARKWAWDKIDGVKAPQNRYAAFGSRVHKILEAWFEHGTPPPKSPEGRTARKILAHLPPPQQPHVQIERDIDLTLGGIKIVGYVDYSIFLERPRPFVSDHKTCGNFTYALTPETMPDDVQVSSYGYEAMLRTNAREVDLQWTYGTRDGKKSKPVRATLTYDQIKPRLEKTAESAAKMKMIYESGVPAIEVPHNAAGCGAFGGCFYNTPTHCNLTTLERFQSIMSQAKTEGAFLSKLRNKKKKNGAAEAPTAPPAATEAPPAPEADAAAEPPTEVPTSSGTVNPPSAPATAPANPESAPAKEKKTKRGRGRPRKDKTAAAPAKSATPPPAVASTITAAEKPVGEPVVSTQGAVVTVSVEQLIGMYQRGVRDGFEMGLKK